MLRLDQPRRRFHFWNKWGPQVDCRLASYVAKTHPSEPNGRSAEPDNLFVLMNLGVPRHHTSYSALKAPLPEKDSISLVDIREVGGSSIPIHASPLSPSALSCANCANVRADHPPYGSGTDGGWGDRYGNPRDHLCQASATDRRDDLFFVSGDFGEKEQ